MLKQNKTEVVRLRVTLKEAQAWAKAKHNNNNTSELIRKSVNYYIYRVAEG